MCRPDGQDHGMFLSINFSSGTEEKRSSAEKMKEIADSLRILYTTVRNVMKRIKSNLISWHDKNLCFLSCR